nr:immunoglobulin heavy chain junction region [Macaca mulatta]MOV47937.1 immunoglobulin heavy chain junction region [Macaca mulatta]MOV48020.1 immunoglobulin heavy chain junction region [Macaca mulatta]MOV48136.1 immunoglobulin heavy chain junction region [Macaca mulatta]MOV48161.1 immunoglobulin heavy chain junction region [Macaca mulatta]
CVRGHWSGRFDVW